MSGQKLICSVMLFIGACFVAIHPQYVDVHVAIRVWQDMLGTMLVITAIALWPAKHDFNLKLVCFCILIGMTLLFSVSSISTDLSSQQIGPYAPLLTITGLTGIVLIILAIGISMFANLDK